MPLSELLSAERIAALSAPSLSVPSERDAMLADAQGVLAEAARLLARSEADAAAIAESLAQREALCSTGIGHGVAIPHGRSREHLHARAAFLRLDVPVPFGAADGEPVDLVFAMVVPEHFTQQHLEWLAQIAERFAQAPFRDALRAAPDADALRALLMPPPAHAAAA